MIDGVWFTRCPLFYRFPFFFCVLCSFVCSFSIGSDMSEPLSLRGELPTESLGGLSERRVCVDEWSFRLTFLLYLGLRLCTEDRCEISLWPIRLPETISECPKFSSSSFCAPPVLGLIYMFDILISTTFLFFCLRRSTELSSSKDI